MFIVFWLWISITFGNSVGKEKWRKDGRCGYKFLLPDGNPTECNPVSNSCCSKKHICVDTKYHCCSTCIDYKPLNVSWDQWNNWSACSSKCGGGMRNRTRVCGRPPSEGLICLKVDDSLESVEVENQTCNNKTCSTPWITILVSVVAVLIATSLIIIVCCVRRKMCGKNKIYKAIYSVEMLNEFPAGANDMSLESGEAGNNGYSHTVDQQYEEIPCMTNTRSYDNPNKEYNTDNEYEGTPMLNKIGGPYSYAPITGISHEDVSPMFNPRHSNCSTQEYDELNLPKPGIDKMETRIKLENDDNNTKDLSNYDVLHTTEENKMMDKLSGNSNENYIIDNEDDIPMTNNIKHSSYKPTNGILHEEVRPAFQPRTSDSSIQEYDELNLPKPGIDKMETKIKLENDNTNTKKLSSYDFLPTPEESTIMKKSTGNPNENYNIDDEYDIPMSNDVSKPYSCTPTTRILQESDTSTQEYDEMNLPKPGIDKMETKTKIENDNTDTKNSDIGLL